MTPLSKYFIEQYQANIEAKTINGNTTLHHPSSNDEIEVVKYLK